MGGYAGLGAVAKVDAPFDDDPGFCIGSSVANGSFILVL